MSLKKRVIALIVTLSMIMPILVEDVYAFEHWINDTTLKIYGEARVGEELYARIGEEEPIGVLFQWYRSDSDNIGNDGKMIPGATESTYTIQPEDEEKYLYLIIHGDGEKYDVYNESVSEKTYKVIGTDEDNEFRTLIDDCNLETDFYYDVETNNELVNQKSQYELPEFGEWYYQGVTFSEEQVKLLREHENEIYDDYKYQWRISSDFGVEPIVQDILEYLHDPERNDFSEHGNIICSEGELPDRGEWTYRGVAFSDAQVIILNKYFGRLAKEKVKDYTVEGLCRIIKRYSSNSIDLDPPLYTGNLDNRGLTDNGNSVLPESGTWVYQGITFSDKQVEWLRNGYASLWFEDNDIKVTARTILSALHTVYDDGYWDDESEEWRPCYGNYEDEGELVVNSGELPKDGEWTYGGVLFADVAVKFLNSYFGINAKKKVHMYTSTELKEICEKHDVYWYDLKFIFIDDSTYTTEKWKSKEVSNYDAVDYIVTGSEKYDAYRTGSVLSVLGLDSSQKCKWYRVSSKAEYCTGGNIIGNEHNYVTGEDDEGSYVYARVNDEYVTNLFGPIHKTRWKRAYGVGIREAQGEYSYTADIATLSLEQVRNDSSGSIRDISKVTWYSVPTYDIFKDLSDYDDSEQYICGNDFTYDVGKSDVGNYIFAVYERCDIDAFQYETDAYGPIEDLRSWEDSWVRIASQNVVTGDCTKGIGASGGTLSILGITGIDKCTWYKTSLKDDYDQAYSENDKLIKVAEGDEYTPDKNDIGSFIFSVYSLSRNKDLKYKSNFIGPIYEYDRVKWERDDQNYFNVIPRGLSANLVDVTLSVKSDVTKCTWYRVPSEYIYNNLNMYSAAKSYIISSGTYYKLTREDIGSQIFAVYECNSDASKQYKSCLSEVVKDYEKTYNWQISPSSKKMSIDTSSMKIVSRGNDNRYVTGSSMSVIGVGKVSRCSWYRVDSYNEYISLSDYVQAEKYKISDGTIYNTSIADVGRYIFAVAEFDDDFTRQYKSDLIGPLASDDGKYRIQYLNVSSDVTNDNPTFFSKKSSRITLKDAKKRGYLFEGWYADSRFEKRITVIDTSLEEDISIYARWSPITYRVRFNGNGVNIPSKDEYLSCTFDDTATIPYLNLHRPGYIFAGWNRKADGSGEEYIEGNEYINLSSINSDVVNLYAIWEKENYSIEYIVNGGINSKSNPETYNIGTSTITLKTPAKQGYTFGGWYADAEFIRKVTSIPKGSFGDKILYAKWTVNTYTVAFNANGGKGAMSSIGPCIYDEVYNIPDNAFERTGYNFVGWNTLSSGKGTYFYEGETFERVAEKAGTKATLYAIWERIPYSVSYDLDGGTNHKSNPETIYVNSGTITLKNPTKPGYTFKGWYADAEYTTKVTKIVSSELRDVELYAKWERKIESSMPYEEYVGVTIECADGPHVFRPDQAAFIKGFWEYTGDWQAMARKHTYEELLLVCEVEGHIAR